MVTGSYQNLYPFKAHWLDTDGGRLHYVDEGDPDAPPMLMLHGNPTWSFYYRDLIRAFSADYRVVAPDHLGCGLSDKPADYDYSLDNRIKHVTDLAEALDLEDVTLVVHDWGGAIGMGWAVANPVRVGRFVVFNTAAFLASRIPFSIDICRIRGFGAVMIRGLNAFARAALIRAVHHRDRLTPDVQAGYLAPYDSWGNRVAHLRFVQDIPMSAGHPSYQRLERIGAGLVSLADRPMLIIWGAHDFCFDDAFFEEWKRRFPDAKTHYVEDAGHYVVEDAHERIIPWMKAYLHEVTP